MSLRTLDELADEGSPTGTLILNQGDPAFSRARGQEAILAEAEAHFIHLVAYLLFAETVVVPSRYVIDGPVMAQVAYWAAPLLREGILIPERRGGFASFEEVAAARGSDEAGRRRADFLDLTSVARRTFQFDELGEIYVKRLTADLEPSGGFRHVVPGGQKGRLAPAVDQFLTQYRGAIDVTPENFSRVAASVEPRLAQLSLQWAMARYYTTPLFFDEANTREVPERAANLLIAGKALDVGLPLFATAAPVQRAQQRIANLVANVPNRRVRDNHEQYCEALLEVRRTTPEARRIFTEIRDRAAIENASTTVTKDFERELARQMKVKTKAGPGYVVVSSLLGGAAGLLTGAALQADPLLQAAGGVVSSVGSGLVAHLGGKGLEARRSRSSAPWLLAVDRLEQGLGS